MFGVTGNGLALLETAPDVTVEDVISNTEAEVIVAPTLKTMQLT